MSKNLKTISQNAWSEIEKIQSQYGYSDIDKNFYLGRLKESTYFADKFSCHDHAEYLNEVPIEKASIITGFGPTNTPTAGTLSVLLKAINLQKETGFYTEIIISELGAWNSRNMPMEDLIRNAQKFIEFIKLIGFDYDNGRVHTHLDYNNLIVSGTLGKILTEKDFRDNKEATDALYDAMALRTNALGIMVDGLYTVSDILNPLFTKNKNRVLVLAGIEEHYFTLLARIALERIRDNYPSLLPNVENVKIGAMYTKLVEGLYPYPKMSKSIPDSAININDSFSNLKKKIIDCDPRNERIILQMIHLVSNWSKEKLDLVNNAYAEQSTEWHQYKVEYYEYFAELAKKWKQVEEKFASKSIFYQNVFKND